MPTVTLQAGSGGTSAKGTKRASFGGGPRKPVVYPSGGGGTTVSGGAYTFTS